jgi:pimeloyl-ACP methyl ester carboxylesterase
MTIGTDNYAVLAKDAYQAPRLQKDITLDGVVYRAIDYADNPTNGFQATAYERMDTREIVIAFRGTEFDREPIKDGGVDAGMVLTGLNAQTPDAMAFTQRVLGKAKELEQINHQVTPVTVTGHSLGGTLAEITAAKFGLKGETFNAYGAAGLIEGVPAGGHQVIDHVRATDLVSAASRHFGEVHIYAVQDDINTLTKAGYRDDSTLLSPRNPFKAIDFGAHAMDNFVPDNKLFGHSIINADSQKLYHDHQQMIDRYRHDVLDLRTGISASWEIPKAITHGVETAGTVVAEKAREGLHAAEHVAHEAAEAVDHAGKAIKNEVIRDAEAVERTAKAVAHATEEAYDKASAAVKREAIEGAHKIEGAAKAVVSGAEHAFDSARKEVSHDIEATGKALRAAGDAISEKASSAFDKLSHPGSWFQDASSTEKPALNHPSHPDHALFQQARSAVHQLDASRQRAPDARSDNLAASLAVAARGNGMNQIDHVVLSDDASRAYAVQGDLKSPFKQIAQVDTAQAMAAPVEQSSAAWAQQQARLQASHALAQNTPAQQIQQNQPMPGP